MPTSIVSSPSLSSAEDFFRLLDLPYDEAVLNVHRLHILSRLRRYLDQAGVSLAAAGAGLSEAEKGVWRQCLARAYDEAAQAPAGQAPRGDFSVFAPPAAEVAPSRAFIPLSDLRTPS